MPKQRYYHDFYNGAFSQRHRIVKHIESQLRAFFRRPQALIHVPLHAHTMLSTQTLGLATLAVPSVILALQKALRMRAFVRRRAASVLARAFLAFLYHPSRWLRASLCRLEMCQCGNSAVGGQIVA